MGLNQLQQSTELLFTSHNCSLLNVVELLYLTKYKVTEILNNNWLTGMQICPSESLWTVKFAFRVCFMVHLPNHDMIHESP